MATKVTATLLGKTIEVSAQSVYDGTPPKKSEDAAESGGNLFRIVSRAKRQVLELASSNDWQYFVTTTCDPAKVDRRNTKAAQSAWMRFGQYTARKTGEKLAYLAVPEPHPNGWGYHAHALATCPGAVLKPYEPSEYRKLPFAIKRAYERAKAAGRQIYHCPWMDEHLGWNLWEPVDSPEKIQNYITKYIDKTLAEAAAVAASGAAAEADVSTPGAATAGQPAKRADLYFHSRGLNHPPRRILKPTQTTYSLLDQLEEMSKDVLHMSHKIGGGFKVKTRAWLGVREYNGEVVGRTYRVDRANVSEEQWDELLRQTGLDPVSLAVLQSEYGE